MRQDPERQRGMAQTVQTAGKWSAQTVHGQRKRLEIRKEGKLKKQQRMQQQNRMQTQQPLAAAATGGPSCDLLCEYTSASAYVWRSNVEALPCFSLHV